MAWDNFAQCELWVQAPKRAATAVPKTPQPQKKAKTEDKAPESAPAKVQGKGMLFHFI